MRRLRAILLSCALVLAASGHAADRTYAYTAETVSTAKRASVTAGGVAWTCAGTRCTANGRGGRVSTKGCSELARAVGPIAAYRSETNRLDAAGLEECNRIAQGGAPATKAGAAAAAKPPAKPAGPQRATTDELTFTGIAIPRQ
jgi:hypothetical protein